MPPPRQPPSSDATAKALAELGPDPFVAATANIEAALGGRMALVDALLPAAVSDEERYVVGLLADPLTAGEPLSKVLRAGKVTLPQLLTLFRNAKLAKAHLLSIGIVADGLPAVARTTMTLGAEHLRLCEPCEGTGFVTPDPTPALPNPTPVKCGACAGKGKSTYLPDVKERALALELGQMLAKGGGVSVHVNQQTAVKVDGGGMGEGMPDFVALTRVTDKILYGDQRTRRRQLAQARVDAQKGKGAEGAAGGDHVGSHGESRNGPAGEILDGSVGEAPEAETPGGG